MLWIITSVIAFSISYGSLIYMLRELEKAGHEVPSQWLANIPLFWSPEILSFKFYKRYWQLAPQKGWSRVPWFAAVVCALIGAYSFLHYCIVDLR